jgi:hypothetical protein
LKRSADGREAIVHDAECAVAVVARVRDDAEPEQIVDRLEVATALHLREDRVEVLGPAADLRLDPRRLEALFQLHAHLRQERLALLVLRLHALGEIGVHVGLEHLEAQVLELALDRRHAEPVRERRVDVARLERDAVHLLGRQVLDRAHVVQAVGELDEDDAQIARHRQQHLAEVLGLRRFLAIEVEAGQLRHALDEGRDLAAEALLDVLERDGCVLDDVVEQRRGHDRRVRARVEQLDEQQRDGDGVRHVRLARAALLLAVRGRGEVVARRDAVAVDLGATLVQCGQQGGAKLGVERGAPRSRLAAHRPRRSRTRSWTR